MISLLLCLTCHHVGDKLCNLLLNARVPSMRFWIVTQTINLPSVLEGLPSPLDGNSFVPIWQTGHLQAEFDLRIIKNFFFNVGQYFVLNILHFFWVRCSHGPNYKITYNEKPPSFPSPLTMILFLEGAVTILKLRDVIWKYRILISLETCRLDNCAW